MKSAKITLFSGIIHIPIIISAVVLISLVASFTVIGAGLELGGRQFEYLCQRFPNLPKCRLTSPTPSSKPTASPTRKPTPSASAIPSPTPVTKTSPEPSPSLGPSPSPTTYIAPGGKYKITIPADWVVNGTMASQTYSTTKFTGPNGYVAITFGSGKDPIGGCSETSNVELADRTISGCFLLQKDGSQILTRAYTKDKMGIDFTIEAYINSPLSYHRPVVLSVIGTIDIE